MYLDTASTKGEKAGKTPPVVSSLLLPSCRLAAYIFHGEMAPLTDYKKQCHWCYAKHNCTLFHKVGLFVLMVPA